MHKVKDTFIMDFCRYPSLKRFYHSMDLLKTFIANLVSKFQERTKFLRSVASCCMIKTKWAISEDNFLRNCRRIIYGGVA
ncbi:hypothetical protein CEXT_526631 [Caerostris extrusa]|uniref:Uncharacterized protein n=1 Tax=Caerostris extrusa TaxID=172846 RepID=A0AAV4YBS9_CAEEX|nr:hypothetical protein CEXT_526631 [Caerostris extrusa]